MRILVTSPRMPFALDEIRKLGRCGHAIYTAGTMRTAPAVHSNLVREHFHVPSPTFRTRDYVSAIVEIVERTGVELIVPQFEEVFFLARHADALPDCVELFAPSFETLALLHDKAAFAGFCAKNGMPVPETTIAHSQTELREAIDLYPRWFARAAFSRGGVELLTNTGPLAGVVSIEDCQPTEHNPWVVQAFVEGVDECSFSVVQEGEIVAHCTYTHPKTIEHGGGIRFVSVEDTGALELAAAIARETRYRGQLSLDYMRTEDGVVLIECNPRPTDGCLLVSGEALAGSITGELPPGPPVVTPAGRTEEIGAALLRDMIQDWHAIPDDLCDLLRTPDAYVDRHDMLPVLYLPLSYAHVFTYRHDVHPAHRNARTDLLQAQFYDITWDGGPIP